jgi:hypothetical protein
MGMYDTVHWKCPLCEAENETQSKAGDCELKNYRITSVPAEIAASMMKHSEECKGCGKSIKFLGAPKRVSLTPSDAADFFS